MIEKILNSIENELKKNNQHFFSYAWRENIINFVENESKYDQLLKWINNQIELQKDKINVLNPADKLKNYSIENFKTYMDALRDFAFLVNMKEILCDTKATNEMRDNVEYSICKIFKIEYSEFLKCYV